MVGAMWHLPNDTAAVNLAAPEAFSFQMWVYKNWIIVKKSIVQTSRWQFSWSPLNRNIKTGRAAPDLSH